MTCKYCGHEAEHHAPISGCMLSDCPCGRFAPEEEPEHPAPPCARCGHTLYQHSTGECDLQGCACDGYVGKPEDWQKVFEGRRSGPTRTSIKAEAARLREAEAVPDIRPGGVYFAEPTNYHRDDDLGSMLIVAFIVMGGAGAVVGVFIGWLLWGLTC